jgi:hypothetical protein
MDASGGEYGAASSRRAFLALAATTATTIAGCETRSPAEQPGTPPAPPADAAYATTASQPSGNNALDGAGDLAAATPVDIAPPGTPAWLLAFGGRASHWTVVTTDGHARTYRVADGGSDLVTDHGRVATPPLAYRADGAVGLVTPPADSAALSSPVVLADGLLYVAANGDIVRRRADGTVRLGVDAPPDARIVELDERRYVLYGDRTDRYRHGALGDSIEGSSLALVDVERDHVSRTRLPAPLVFEGLAPLVADLDADGRPEIVTTVADAADGARIRAYTADGTAIATGASYGPGWRHQLCVAPFPPDGHPELAVVRKPHVDRTLEFYRLTPDGLTVTATRPGFSSHTYGSRVVAGGLAVDGDDDGRPALLVPTAERTTLAAIRRTAAGTARAFSLSLGGTLATNLTGVTLADGGVAVGAGTADRVRVWQA